MESAADRSREGYLGWCRRKLLRPSLVSDIRVYNKKWLTMSAPPRDMRPRRPRPPDLETSAESQIHEPPSPSCRLQWPAADYGLICPCLPGRNNVEDRSRVIASEPELIRSRPQGNAPPARPPRERTPRWGWGGGGVLLLGFALLSLFSPALTMSPSEGLNSVTENGVCSSMDIRNSPDKLLSLKGCRVVEGFVQILLIENTNSSAFDNLTFPELREITDYLLIFRVTGLRTLSTLFPNLAVIRGNRLFHDYAFVIYEMQSMQDIGLFSLTDITRGSVRIEKNAHLCYINTIDWKRIAPTEWRDNFIQDNKNDNECLVCPGDDHTRPGLVCPKFKLEPNEPERRLCWNQDHCQKICKPECGSRTCAADGKCCDEGCLGGCTGPQYDNCTVCKDLSIGDLMDRKCIRDCPNNTFKHFYRRCITASECRRQERPKDVSSGDKGQYPYKPFNGTCLTDCPPNYFEDIVDNLTTCKLCEGTCRKDCPGMKLDSIQAIQLLRGCTHINGSLEINMGGKANIVKELEEGCGLIQEISGILKVTRSVALVSLGFFKSLKVIKGEPDEFNAKKSSFINGLAVTDNQNLEELWNWDEHGPIDIQHGQLNFHFNPKLCMEKIEPLRTMARETEFDDKEVSRHSNGDKFACNVSLLNVTVSKKTDSFIMLSWDPFKLDDARSLLGYTVYYMQAPYQNITLLDGREACGGDRWGIIDAEPYKDQKSVIIILPHLKAYTQYAIYVHTSTITTERQGAKSNVFYVRTLPGRPSPPRIWPVNSPSPSSLMLQWDPPKEPNGELTVYHIIIHWEEDKEDILMHRNYCSDPLVSSSEKNNVIKTEEAPKVDKLDEKCQCEKKNPSGDDEEMLAKISFEDMLHNTIYIKREEELDEETRRRRDLDSVKERWTEPAPVQEYTTVMDENKKVFNSIARTQKETTMNVSQLRHYGTYSISITACRKVEPEEFEALNNSAKYQINNCSHKSITTARTLKLEGADDVTTVEVHVLPSNQSLGMARVDWSEPEDPNGLIIKYQIIYNRVDAEGIYMSTQSACLSRYQYKINNKHHIIKNLHDGNYSIQIMATSLAGNGNYSHAKFFQIKTPNTGGNSQTGVIVPVVVVVLLLCGVVGYLIYRRFMPPPPPPTTKLIASVNPEYVSTVYVPDEWEVPRDKIQLVKELGQGSFGMVYEGIAQDITKNETSEIRCAVKTVNEHATDRERIEFLNEASVMKAFDTAHVVRLLGVVSRGQPTLVIMELMANGDLKSYLRSHRPDTETPRNSQPPSLDRILQMAMEIADGMAYLSAKKFVHRDLAARNCMVADDLTVKVGDFGMTRDIYETDYYRKGSKGLLPVRWMSPESLKDGVFTSSSDVWSYGVVLWEMATLASQPYQGLSNDQVLRYVIDGGVMERPENCPDRLYQLMQITWQHRPSARPSFLQLVSVLVGDASPVFRSNSFFYSPQGQEMFQQSQPPTAGTSEEPEPSASGDELMSWKNIHASMGMGSDISPPASPRQTPSSYVLRGAHFRERARAEPHETEALVSNLSQSAPPKPSPPSTQTAPNGFLPRYGNNGNPSSLSTSRC